MTWIGNGLKLLIERSKTDAQGEGAEIAIPRGQSDDTCPVAALKTWLELSEITTGPLFRKVNRGGVVERAPGWPLTQYASSFSSAPPKPD